MTNDDNFPKFLLTAPTRFQILFKRMLNDGLTFPMPASVFLKYRGAGRKAYRIFLEGGLIVEQGKLMSNQQIMDHKAGLMCQLEAQRSRRDYLLRQLEDCFDKMGRINFEIGLEGNYVSKH